MGGGRQENGRKCRAEGTGLPTSGFGFELPYL